MNSQGRSFSNLQAKVLAAVGSAFLILTLGQLSVARTIIMRGFSELEVEQARTNAERMARALERETANLSALTSDWSRWDDTYEYVRTKDPEYIESNLVKQTFDDLSMNLIAIFDRDRNLVFGQIYEFETDTLVDIPAAMLDNILQHPELLHKSIEVPRSADLFMLDRGPILAANHLILTSEGEGPARGYILMARFFEDSQLESLAEDTRLPVERVLYNADIWSDDIHQIVPTLERDSDGIAVQALNSKEIASYALIEDEGGEPIIILKARTNRDILARGQTSFRYYLWSSSLVGAGFCILTLWLLRSLVLLRVESLNRQVSQVSASKRDPDRISLAGRDELSQLARTVQDGFQQLHQRTTELSRAKQEAEVAKETADGANRAKSAFLANMSHELRTPLNAILGFAQILGFDRSLTSEQREKISIINHSGAHLLSLINDVLDMSKIESGQNELHASDFDLVALLDNVNDMMSVPAEVKGIELVFNCADDVPRYLCSDSRKLRQTLINLLGNAIKFTHEGKVELTVQPLKDAVLSASEQDIHVQFSVRDTGLGIAAEDLPHLFEAFVQTEAGRQSQQGSGLGLAISQKFVELMGGELSVVSQVDRGTTFTFDIWATEAKAAAAPSISGKRRPIGLEPGQSTYRIAIVDDRPTNRKLLLELLGPIGFELREAENGREAIAQWETWRPHLIWMDMRMPVMDGYEATRTIREHPEGNTTKIVALTASTLEEEKAIVLAAGCDDFVRKPFLHATITQKIAEHLGVQYRYDDKETTATLSPHSDLNDEALQAGLDTMSADWIEALRQAATQLKGSDIITLIEQIPPEHRDLQHTIKTQVDNFDFDRVLALTDPVARRAIEL